MGRPSASRDSRVLRHGDYHARRRGYIFGFGLRCYISGVAYDDFADFDGRWRLDGAEDGGQARTGEHSSRRYLPIKQRHLSALVITRYRIPRAMFPRRACLVTPAATFDARG